MHAARLLLPAMVLALSLTACASSQTDTARESANTEITDDDRPSLASITPENPAKLLPRESDDGPRGFLDSYELAADSPTEAYSKVLWYLFQYGSAPGEDGSPDYNYSEYAHYNQFAIYDIDQDGRDELLFDRLYRANVWEYRDGILYEELVAFPDGLTFYDNGAVHENASHNQGPYTSENFWPYGLYTYHAETDSYRCAGDVQGWDIRNIDLNNSDFPANIDQDGDGMVYFLYRTNDVQYDASGNPMETLPVDGPEYEAWRDSILRDSQPVAVPWQSLTRENVSALGYPEPEMPDWRSYLAG